MPAEERTLTFGVLPKMERSRLLAMSLQNTNYDPGPSVKAVSFGEDGSLAQGVVARHQHRWVACRVPHGEAGRKAGCRKSARPV